jgi:D-arabinose 1-dehydrogenase-like Zn-dependent alcohol dehydrogenase
MLGKPLEQIQLQLKEWDEDSVEMNVSHCGVCGSDVHTLDESWGPTDYPCVVGHEIVGVVTRVGKNVDNVKPGDRAGVGAQSGSCHECDNCKDGFENTCKGLRVSTYNKKWANGDKSFGGFADKWRGDYRFVFKIPDNLPSEVAATFFCAGVTTYAPLKRANVNSNSVVGVMGIGGLGHYAILWAKAMGAKVIGMSHSDKKRDVALELGCDDFLVTSDDAQMAKFATKMTHILCTGTGSDFKWERYLNLIKVNGHFIHVMLPEWQFPEMSPLVFIRSQVYISGSAIGSPADIKDMLEFAAEHNVRPWIQVCPMKDIEKVIQEFRDGKPRFRFILEN